jgi:hypothetical protein
MQQNFLPSKQFRIRVLVIIILTLGVFSVYKIVNFIKDRPSKNNEIKLVTKMEKVKNDGNDNGIPDWEERLWGLNPDKDGTENKEYILAKRKALNPNVDLSSYEENLSENETLNREFFAVLMSLQQTGDLDENAIETISNTYSQKIEAEPIPDIYTKDMLKITPDTPENTEEYYRDLQNLISKYQDSDIGSELGLIVQAIAYNDPQVLSAVQSIAVSYREFGQELIKIPVTDFLFEVHLGLANNYEKNARSVYAMTLLFDDPLQAMKGIINYKKYNDLLSGGLELLSSVFEVE